MFDKFDRTRLELTRQAPEFDLNNHLLRQVAIEADPGVYFIKKPTNAALNLLLDQEVLRDAVEMLAQVEARLGHLEAVFRGDGDRKTCGCGWLNGVHTPRQHWVSQGMGTYFSTCLPLHLFPCIPLIYIHSYPVLSSTASTSLAGSSTFWFACPSTQRKPTVKTLA
jgi:hypothetical protein